jgi:DNA-binding CsgD family transcriptional regulator
MERLPESELRSVLNALLAINVVGGIDSLPERIVSAVSSLIPSDRSFSLVLDPTTPCILSSAFQPERAGTAPGSQALLGYVMSHPLYLHACETGELAPMRRSALITSEAYWAHCEQSGFAAGGETEFQLTLSLPADPTRHVWIELHRRQRDFSERDEVVLGLLRPHLIQALLQAQAVAELDARRGLLARAAAQLNVGLVTINPDATVRYLSPRARELLGRYFGASPGPGEYLPDPVAAWLETQLHASDAQPLAAPGQWPFISEGLSHCLVARFVSRAGRNMLIVQEQEQPLRESSLEAFGLTRREIQVLLLVAEGQTNLEIGRALHTSARTVGKHLEHIFTKLGVDSRTAAAARAIAIISPFGFPAAESEEA